MRSFLSKLFLVSPSNGSAKARSGHVMSAVRPKRSRSRRGLRVESLERRDLFAGLQFDNMTDLDASTWDIDVDQAGNSYVSGTFAGTVDFDPGLSRPDGSDTLTARGFKDIFVAKYTPAGQLTWAVQFGGDSPSLGGLKSDIGTNIEVDTAGNVYVGGMFVGTGTFGTKTLTAVNGGDTFVAKLNSSGVVQWVQSWNGTDEDQLIGMAVDSLGNVVAASHDYGASTIIKKFAPSGSTTWTKSITTNIRVTAQGDVAVDSSGNIYVADTFYGTVDFDPSNRVKSVSNFTSSLGTAYVLSLNASGSFRWVSPFLGQPSASGTYGSAGVTSLAIDKTGNVLVGGFQTGPVDFQASPATVIMPDKGGVLLNLNPSTGYLNWAKTFSSTDGTAYLMSIDVDSTGNIYTAGYFYGTVDFDPGAGVVSRSSVNRNTDLFFMKLSATGNLVWAETLGDVGSETALGIAVDSSGAIQVVGNLQGYDTPTTIDLNLDPLISNTVTAESKLRTYRVRMKQI